MKRINRPRDYRRPILIVCEGHLETFYFQALDAWRRDPLDGAGNLYFNIICNDGKGPESIVAKAVAKAHDGCREVWCVLDVEGPNNSEKRSRALAHAERSKIKIALTNPSFDAWAIAHLDPLPPVHASSAKCYMDALTEALGVGFSQAGGMDFARRILGDNCCHVERARSNIRRCNNASEVRGGNPPGTNLHCLVDIFFPNS